MMISTMFFVLSLSLPARPPVIPMPPAVALPSGLAKAAATLAAQKEAVIPSVWGELGALNAPAITAFQRILLLGDPQRPALVEQALLSLPFRERTRIEERLGVELSEVEVRNLVDDVVRRGRRLSNDPIWKSLAPEADCMSLEEMLRFEGHPSYFGKVLALAETGWSRHGFRVAQRALGHDRRPNRGREQSFLHGMLPEDIDRIVFGPTALSADEAVDVTWRIYQSLEPYLALPSPNAAKKGGSGFFFLPHTVNRRLGHWIASLHADLGRAKQGLYGVDGLPLSLDVRKTLAAADQKARADAALHVLLQIENFYFRETEVTAIAVKKLGIKYSGEQTNVTIRDGRFGTKQPRLDKFQQIFRPSEYASYEGPLERRLQEVIGGDKLEAITAQAIDADEGWLLFYLREPNGARYEVMFHTWAYDANPLLSLQFPGDPESKRIELSELWAWGPRHIRIEGDSRILAVEATKDAIDFTFGSGKQVRIWINGMDGADFMRILKSS